MSEINLILGDCLEALEDLEPESFDAVLTDPPYGIGFMGRKWDSFSPSEARSQRMKSRQGRVASRIATSSNPNLKGRTRAPAISASSIAYDLSPKGLLGYQRFTMQWARAAFRVLKPGGYVLSFGMPRTYHRMACGLEDAGFEVRDSIAWISGQGFPKNLDVKKDLVKRGLCCVCVQGVSRGTAAASGEPTADLLRADVHGAGPSARSDAEDLRRVSSGLGTEGSHAGGSEADVLENMRDRNGAPPTSTRESSPNGIVGPVFGVREGDLVSAFASSQSQSADVLAPMRGQTESLENENDRAPGPGGVDGGIARELSSENERREEPGVEGRRHVQATQGELQTDDRGPLSSGVLDHGEGERVRVAASARDGNLDPPAADADRSRASREPRSASERSDEPRTLAGQPESQARGAWPLCDRCGKPMVAEGLGSALKPGHESIAVARKPFQGRLIDNALTFGTGLNIDATRGTSPLDAGAGRWPPNLVLSHAEGCKPAGIVSAPPLQSAAGTVGGYHGATSGAYELGTGRQYGAERLERVEVWACVPECPIALLNASSGDGEDLGAAGRYFPTFKYEPKAFRTERDAGLEDFEAHTGGELTGRKAGSAGVQSGRAGAGRTSGGRNIHPTVKPLDLMRWLVRLVARPGQRVLEPFAGSGTTAAACKLEGVDCVAIEREPAYYAIAVARVNAVERPPLLAIADELAEAPTPEQWDLLERMGGPPAAERQPLDARAHMGNGDGAAREAGGDGTPIVMASSFESRTPAEIEAFAADIGRPDPEGWYPSGLAGGRRDP